MTIYGMSTLCTPPIPSALMDVKRIAAFPTHGPPSTIQARWLTNRTSGRIYTDFACMQIDCAAAT